MNEFLKNNIIPIELSSDEKKQKQQERTMKDLAELYNQKYPDRHDEALKQEWIADQYEMAIEQEELNQMHERKIAEAEKRILELTKKWQDALIDDVTGFRIRKELFQKMDQELRALFGVETDKSCTSEEWVAILESNKNDFKDIDLSVMMSDISYLSLANEGGHTVGDALLKNIAQKVQAHGVEAYRHGGDEITALLYEPRDVFQNRLKKMTDRIQAQENIANLKEYNLRPNLDFGTAHFSEGLQVFRELLKNNVGRERILNEKPLEELKNIWLEIADKRAFIQKGKTRIALLIDRFSEDWNDYNDIIGFLRKGGYNIKDDELELLIREIDDTDTNQIQQLVMNFIVKKEKEAIDKLHGYKKIKAQLIADLLGIFSDIA